MKQRRRPRQTRRVGDQYPRGHRETISEYLQRVGRITRVAPGVSRHMTDPLTLIHVLNGGRFDDPDTGVGYAELPVDVRTGYREQMYHDQEAADVVDGTND